MKMQPQLLRRLAGFDVMAHVLGSLGFVLNWFADRSAPAPGRSLSLRASYRISMSWNGGLCGCRSGSNHP
jgi:hypothetical protein